MTTIETRYPAAVQKRQQFLVSQFNKWLYIPEQKERVMRLIGELSDRYSYKVTTYKPDQPIGTTCEQITGNGRYSLD